MLYNIFLLILISCNINAHKRVALSNLQIGKLDKGQFGPTKPVGIYNSQMSIRDGKSVTIDDIAYEYTVDSNGRIDYIITRDSDFVSPEGYHVGTKLSMTECDVSKCIIKPGWGTAILLTSGWYAFINKNVEIRQSIYLSDSIVAFFQTRY